MEEACRVRGDDPENSGNTSASLLLTFNIPQARKPYSNYEGPYIRPQSIYPSPLDPQPKALQNLTPSPVAAVDSPTFS